MSAPLLPLQQPASQQDTRWKSLIDPVLSNPILAGQQLNVSVVNGVNTLNHGLGRKLQGYFITSNDSAVTFHDNQSTNASPQLTLVLVSTGAANISLWVY